MNRNTSISLGSYFEKFIEGKISEGRYKNASEMIRAALRLLEEEEIKVRTLKGAIQEGIESGYETNFDPDEYLKNLKAVKHA